MFSGEKHGCSGWWHSSNGPAEHGNGGEQALCAHSGLLLGGRRGPAHQCHAGSCDDNDKVGNSKSSLRNVLLCRVSGGQTIGQDTDGDGIYIYDLKTIVDISLSVILCDQIIRLSRYSVELWSWRSLLRWISTQFLPRSEYSKPIWHQLDFV